VADQAGRVLSAPSLHDAARQAFRGLPPPVRDTLRAARQPGAWLARRKRRAALVPFLVTVDAFCGGLRAQRVLEVGADGEGLLIQEIESRFGSAVAVGVNPAFPPASFSATCRLEAVDVRRMPYADGSFDVVVSSSAFEHIHEIDRALLEMHRILVPGGRLYSHFGPIWSTSYGHHLWMTYRGRLFNYWNTILPPWCHLLMTPREVVEHCHQSPDAGIVAAAEPIAEYVFGSSEQNRLLYEDYERIVQASPFEVGLFKGYDHPELAALHQTADIGRRLDQVHRRHPAARNFGYDGITVLLRKS
jgi:SAM-dependent methyltransferase